MDDGFIVIASGAAGQKSVIQVAKRVDEASHNLLTTNPSLWFVLHARPSATRFKASAPISARWA